MLNGYGKNSGTWFWVFILSLVSILSPSLLRSQLTINEVSSSNSEVIEDEFGNSPDWIEIINSSNTSLNLSGYSMSDNPDEPLKWVFPDLVLAANERLLVFASGRSEGAGNIHASFKLSRTGEFLSIFDPQENSIESLLIPELLSDVSYARIPDQIGNWNYTTSPTPNEINVADDLIQRTPSPSFQFEKHFNSTSTSLSISGEGTIRYTLDGNIPDDESLEYTEPILLEKTTAIRARSFSNNQLPSPIISETIFINSAHELAVVALIGEPEKLFDEEEGMFVPGPGADSLWPYFGANFWKDIKVDMELSYFDEDKIQQIHQTVESQIHGGRSSRTLPQKSIRFTAEKRFGPDRINYPFFENNPDASYKNLVLRNGSGDWGHAHMRDAYLSQHFVDWGLDLEASLYRPAAVYINGEYYGLMNLREKLDRYYVGQHDGGNFKDIDLLEIDTIIQDGDFEKFNEDLEFITTTDLSIASNYEEAIARFDINNLTDYFIIQTAINNFDWPGNNIKYWRERKEGAKWRYILFDLDACCGRYGWTNAPVDGLGNKYNEFSEIALLRILNAFLSNDQYFNYFINRYADILNELLRPENINGITETAAKRVEAEMARHFNRWGNASDFEAWSETRVPKLYSFFTARPDYSYDYLQNNFQLDSMVNLSLNSYPIEAGKITINSISPAHPWDGIYYKGVPVSISVEANPGYTFKYWRSSKAFQDPVTGLSFTHDFQEDDQIVAFFEEAPTESSISIYPNPVFDDATIDIVLPDFETISMALYNVQGQLIREDSDQAAIPGTNKINWDVSGLAQGMYFLNLRRENGEMMSAKFFHFGSAQ